MQRSGQSSILNTYAGDRFSDDDDDDSGSDASEDHGHEQFHDAYATVFEACLHDDSSSSSVQSEEPVNTTHEDLKSTAPSESEAENSSFIYPCEDEDQRPDLDALSNAYSLLHTASSLGNESLISTTTIRGRRIRFETFTLQDFKRLHLVPPPTYLEASASPKQVKEGLRDPQSSHVKEDSGFEDDEMLRPLIQYSFPPEATWTSYKPLPVIDAQAGLLRSPSIPPEKRLALPVRRFRQPTFPEIKREELPPLSDDEDDEIVDFSAPNSRGASNNESILPSVSLPQGRNQPAPMSNMGRKPIESNGNKFNVTSAGQSTSHSDGFVSSQATSLGCPPARSNQAKSHWESFRPTRSKAASGISDVSLAKSTYPSWDYPRLVRGERTSPGIITASPAMTTKAPPSTVSSACPGNTVVCRTCGSILSSGRQFDSTSSEGEDKVSSVSSSPSLVNKEAFRLNSNVASELDEDESGVRGSTNVRSSTMYMNVPDETSSLAFSQVPTGDAIGHWKIPAAVKHLNAAELSTPARENPAVLPVARHNYALPTSTSPVPSDIAYGWGPEEAADSSVLQESDDKTVTTSPPATGIRWDDDEAPSQNTTRHALDSWDPDVAIKKVPTPGYNISSKARSPTNSAAHPDRQLAPSLDLIRTRHEQGDAASFRVGHTNGNGTGYENKTIPSGMSCVVREPTIPHTSSGGFTQGPFASQSRLF